MIIGIDPGKRSGAAIFDGGQLQSLRTLTPEGIIHLIQTLAVELVVFEDSRLIRATWSRGLNANALRKVARNVGQIDAWCRQIEVVCAAAGVECVAVSPKAKGKKLTPEEFKAMTGWEQRTNQHVRDAAMVAWPWRKARVTKSSPTPRSSNTGHVAAIL